MQCREQNGWSFRPGRENIDEASFSRDEMILIADSSAQDTLATSPAPESLIAGVSSHDSRASSVPRVPAQGVSSPFHVVQLVAHRLSPSMPTMDSTVSSAKPEPELNIGMRESFAISLTAS